MGERRVTKFGAFCGEVEGPTGQAAGAGGRLGWAGCAVAGRGELKSWRKSCLRWRMMDLVVVVLPARENMPPSAIFSVIYLK